jgi:hypothetical protein
VIALPKPFGGLDEGDHRLVVRHGGIAVVDEPARRGLEPTAPVEITRSPRPISGWRPPHEPTRMSVGRFVMARISAITISTLSVPIPSTRWIRAGHGRYR